MFESCEQFVNRMRSKRITYFWSMEGDTHGALIDSAVIGDVGEIEPRNTVPSGGVEDVGDSIVCHIRILSEKMRLASFGGHNCAGLC